MKKYKEKMFRQRGKKQGSFNARVGSISVLVMLVVAIFSSMMLILPDTVVKGAIVDFTSPAWTEVDAEANIDVHDTWIRVDQMDADVESRVFYDYGSGYFTEYYNHSVNFVLGSDDDASSIGYFYFLANTLNGGKPIRDSASYDCIYMYVGWSSGLDARLVLGVDDGSDDDYTILYTINPSTTYYAVVTRAGTTVTFNIYSDSEHTTHISGSPVVKTGCPTTSFQYAYAINSHDGDYGSHYVTYNMSNLDFAYSAGAPPTESSITLTGLASGDMITFTGGSGNEVWSNASYPGGELEINYFINDTDNCSEMRIHLEDIDTGEGLLKGNVSIICDDDNSSWMGNVVQYTGSNFTLSESTWSTNGWGGSPFPIDGASRANATIYLRFKLDIDAGATPGSYETLSTACIVWWKLE